MDRKKHFVFMRLSSLGAAAFLEGCSHVVLFDPKGPIGDAERFVILAAIALMLIVVILVFIMFFLFARKYRASNTKAAYTPKWSYSGKIDLVTCLVPVAIVTALAVLAWSGTHRLNPFKPIDRGFSDMNFKAIAASRLYPESRPTDQPDRLRRRLEYPAHHHTLSPV
jgi:cytochrome o ubiquinol oxidase subunit II